MSSLWTPDGEKPVTSTSSAEPDPAPRQGQSDVREAGDPEKLAEMEELRAQLADTPANVVVANHCFGLFELAALHLSLDPPQLSEAQVAIDALGGIIESLTGRLGEVEPQLQEGLMQLRMAYVQIAQGPGGPAEGAVE